MINLTYSKFEKSLKQIGYRNEKLASEVKNSNPKIFLKIFHFIFVESCDEFYKYLVNQGFPLIALSDLKFMKTIFLLLVK